MEPEQLREADQTLQNVLQIRKEQQVKLGGRRKLDELTKRRIESFMESNRSQWLQEFTSRRDDETSSLQSFLSRFEEMIRRLKMKEIDIDISPQLYEAIYWILSIRYLVHLRLFPSNRYEVHRAVGSTILYNPEPVWKIPEEEEFQWMKHYQMLLWKAVKQRPSDPRSFIRERKIIKDEIEVDPDYAWCRDHPTAVDKAFDYHSDNPRRYLEKVHCSLEALNSSEFDWCELFPGLKKRAAYDYGDPEGSLRKKKEQIQAIRTNSEFEWYRPYHHTMSELALHKTADMRETLRDAKGKLDQTLESPPYEDLRKYPEVITLAIIRNAKDYQRLLLKARPNIEIIEQEPELSWLRDDHTFIDITILQQAPEQYRRNLIGLGKYIQCMQEDPGFRDIDDPHHMLILAQIFRSEERKSLEKEELLPNIDSYVALIEGQPALEWCQGPYQRLRVAQAIHRQENIVKDKKRLMNLL